LTLARTARAFSASKLLLKLGDMEDVCGMHCCAVLLSREAEE
jgi:hypothetical protein